MVRRKLSPQSKRKRILSLKRQIKRKKQEGLGGLIGSGVAGGVLGASVAGPGGAVIGFTLAEVGLGTQFETRKLEKAKTLQKRLNRLRVRKVKR